MIGVFVVVVAAAAAADPAPAAAPQPSNQVSPVVVTGQLKTPPQADATVNVPGDTDNTGAQSVSIWPAAARAAGFSGHVTLSCMVDIHGLAERCRVTYESPPGQGFGEAALALRPTFKLEPRRDADGPVDATMTVAVNFNAAQAESTLKNVVGSASGLGAQPPGGDSGQTNEGVHDIRARDLVTFHNPTDMRRVTLMDSRAWTQAPGFEELAAAYPAQGGGLEGYAVAHCKVENAGTLKGCFVAKEFPTGHGFGKAAVTLAPHFRVSPAVMAQAPRGAPIEADVPVRFPAPAEANDRTVHAPVWVPGSDPETLMRDFPAAVARPGSPGARVRCTVGADGALAGCAIELMSPDGDEFDDAAVRMASRLRMNLWSAEAGPVAGGIVHLPVKLEQTASR